jgi:CheY-like chemotaxis protein
MKKILAIDDEPQVLAIFQRLLEAAGYEAVTTAEPETAMALLDHIGPDLVLLDIMMPGLDGFDLFESIKSACGRVPVLFCTGYPEVFAGQSERVLRLWQKHFEDGLTDIVYKPVTREDLLGKVESLIGPP